MLNAFFTKVRRAFEIRALRERIIYTVFMALVVRLGVHIPLPGVSLERLSQRTASSGFLDFINMLSGGAFSQASIFALGIMPYINASIMIYILTLIVPKLEEMQKEGGAERERLSNWTRYLSIGIAVFHSILTIFFLRTSGLVDNPGIIFSINTVVILTTSVVFLTWVGDQISSKGLGNGTSIIIFIGIVSRVPNSLVSFFRSGQESRFFVMKTALVLAFIFALTAVIVLFQLAQRKIPVYYASSRGSSVGSRSFLPIKVNNAGVMPIIFAGMIFAGMSGLVNLIPNFVPGRGYIERIFSSKSISAIVIYFVLVLFFTFFYTSVIFDPEKIAENLKKSGGSIKGIRPGAETVSYLENIIIKITVGGAFFLAVLAVLPTIMSYFFDPAFAIGGTSILIAVSVSIEILQQIDGAVSMESYKGFV